MTKYCLNFYMAIRHCFYVFICIFADVARIFVFVANVAWVCNMCIMLHATCCTYFPLLHTRATLTIDTAFNTFWIPNYRRLACTLFVFHSTICRNGGQPGAGINSAQALVQQPEELESCSYCVKKSVKQ